MRPHADETGLDFLRRMIAAGPEAEPPISGVLDFRLTEVGEGRAVFEGEPSGRFYNPMGTVHGGWIATLLDSAAACAVHTTLQPGEAYTTLELKVSYLKALRGDTGPVRAVGTAFARGRRAGFAEARLEDASGRLLAHATTTCIVLAADS